MKAYRALGRFRDGAPFRPWLLRIVANEARNRRRSAGRRAGLTLRVAADGGLGGRGSVPRGGRPRPRAAHGAARRPRRGSTSATVTCSSTGSCSSSARRRRPPRSAIRRGTVKSRTSRALERLRASCRRRGRVTPLERELQALSPRAVDWPEAPDVAPPSRAGSADERPRPAPRRRLSRSRSPSSSRRSLAVLAVPPARTAVFDWLGIGGARIVRVDELPSLSPTPGSRSSATASRSTRRAARAGFPFAAPPDDERAPDEMRVAPGHARHLRLARRRARAAPRDAVPR